MPNETETDKSPACLPAEQVQAENSGSRVIAKMSVSQILLKPPRPLKLDRLIALAGPEPVLTTENSDSYRELLVHYMEALKPRDVVTQMLVKYLVDIEWESSRFRRHKALVIERREQRLRELRDTQKTEQKQFGRIKLTDLADILAKQAPDLDASRA